MAVARPQVHDESLLMKFGSPVHRKAHRLFQLGTKNPRLSTFQPTSQMVGNSLQKYLWRGKKISIALIKYQVAGEFLFVRTAWQKSGPRQSSARPVENSYAGA